MEYKNLFFFVRKVPASVMLACIAFLICLPLVTLNVIPQDDCASRYAPMAEAFAVGQWKFAFHPRIPPLFPVACGMIAFIFGITGFTAAKLASALFFSLGAIPLFGIFKRVFDKETAFLGTLLYIFCSHLLRLASTGLRDTAKCLVFFLAVYGIIGIIQKRGHLSGYLYCSLGCAGLALLRGDCLIYAILILFVFTLFEIYHNRDVQFPARSMLSIILFTLLIFPWLWYEYKVIGYPVTESRISIMFTKMEKTFGIDWIYNKNAEIRLPGKESVSEKTDHSGMPDFNEGKNIPIEKSSLPAINLPYSEHANRSDTAKGYPDSQKGSSDKKHDNNPLLDFIESFFKGFYPYFFIIAVPVIFYRIKRRSWSILETVILAALLGHALIQVGQVAVIDHRFYVSRRYLLPVAPLCFAWSAIGMKYAYDFMGHRYVHLLLTILFTALYLDGANRVIKSYSSTKKRETKESIIACAKWIRNDYNGPHQYSEAIPLHYYYYFSGRRPVILTAEPAVGYLAQGQTITPTMLRTTPEEVVKQDQVDYIVLNSANPELDVKQIPGIKKVFSTGLKHYGLDVFIAKGPKVQVSSF